MSVCVCVGVGGEGGEEREGSCACAREGSGSCVVTELRNVYPGHKQPPQKLMTFINRFITKSGPSLPSLPTPFVKCVRERYGAKTEDPRQHKSHNLKTAHGAHGTTHASGRPSSVVARGLRPALQLSSCHKDTRG